MRRTRQPVAVTLVAGLVLAAGGGCTAGGAMPTATPTLRPPAGSAGSSRPGDGSSPATGSTTGSRFPGTATGSVAVLIDAAGRLAGKNLAFMLGNGVTRVEGRHDAEIGATALTRLQDGRRVEVDVFGSDLYLTGFAPGQTVLKVKADELPAGSELLPAAVPLVALQLVSGVIKAEPTGLVLPSRSSQATPSRSAASASAPAPIGTSYSGRIDLTKVDSGGSETVRRLITYLITQAGDRAGDIPFTAVVDLAGRMVGMHVTAPKADAGHDLAIELDIRDIGPPVAVERPTTGVVDAPASFYQS